MSTKPKLSRWRISLIRKKGEFVGFVDALDEVGAIKQAIKDFAITDPEKRSRLVAQRVADKTR
jgi:23S rRNA A1618 N6-methylase RlmF